MARIPILLTPGIAGADGLSLLAREVALAFTEYGERSGVEVWSLTDRTVDDTRVRSARGSRSCFAAWGAREFLTPQRGRTVVTLHAHLAPVALPLVYRGAVLYHFLVGIEAWKPLSLLQVAAIRSATRLIAISRHSAAEFRRANPTFESTEIAIVHPGIPAPNDSSQESVETGYALMVGRMSSEERYKGHDLLLEIWPDVLRLQAGARLVIAGGGDDRQRLEMKGTQLGLGNAVRFLGTVSDAELNHLYRHCAFFIMPSIHEGFGFVFLEAMRQGKACIGARGAASEIIEHGVTGLIVDPANREEVTAAVLRLLREPRLRENMGALGKACFLSRFTRERFIERLRTVLG